MLLYADEDFPFPSVAELQRLGHDVITAQQDGQRSVADTLVLARAHSLGRAVLTCNRGHYFRLHQHGQPHVGIVAAKQDNDHLALATRIHAALEGLTPGRWCIRVNRPWRPQTP